jgi:hypothetical protein
MTPQTHLTRKFAYVVALVQFAAGVSGIIMGASHFTSSSYQPAHHWVKDVLRLPGDPSMWWSGLLAGLAVIAIVALRLGTDRVGRSAFALLAAYWVWWMVLYALALHTPGSGPWAPWLALMCVVGNARPVVARTLAQD